MKKSPAAVLAARKRAERPARNRKQVRNVVWQCRARERRESLGLSLDDVAAALGFAKTTVWQIEQGYDVRLTTAAKVAVFFGVPVESLWPPATVEGTVQP